MAKKSNVVDAEVVDTVPALVVTPNKAPVITGNFDQLEAYLVRNRDRYKGVDFSTADMASVLRVKKEMQVLRVSTEKIEKDVNDNLFNNPKKIIKGNFGRLYALIAEVEAPLDDIIEKDDQKRIDGINFAIDEYVKELTKDRPLEEKYLGRVEKKKAFYNKTQAEADTRADIEEQVEALLKEQKAEKANIRIVKASCAKDNRLSEKVFLYLLERGEDVASVLEAIEEEIKRLDAVDKEATEEAPQEEAGEEQAEEYGGEEPTVEDEVLSLDFESDLPKRTKTKTVKITYPADLSDALSSVFQILHNKGIKSEVIA